MQLSKVYWCPLTVPDRCTVLVGGQSGRYEFSLLRWLIFPEGGTNCIK